MTKTYTLKELTLHGMNAIKGMDGLYIENFTKAILDAIGYEFPKDPEREAFDAWWKDNKIAYVNEDDVFKSWKAGREELRKAINNPSYSMPPSYAGITLLGTKPDALSK